MNPFEILELNNTASPEEVKKQFKQLLKVHHPDHGGTVDNFMELKEAYEKAMKISKNKECKNCLGYGVLYKLNGFRTAQTRCPECKGSGKQYKDKE